MVAEEDQVSALTENGVPASVGRWREDGGCEWRLTWPLLWRTSQRVPTRPGFRASQQIPLLGKKPGARMAPRLAGDSLCTATHGGWTDVPARPCRRVTQPGKEHRVDRGDRRQGLQEAPADATHQDRQGPSAGGQGSVGDTGWDDSRLTSGGSGLEGGAGCSRSREVIHRTSVKQWCVSVRLSKVVNGESDRARQSDRESDGERGSKGS